jgi:high affinity cGMP-specific 3',5'-cyclic phosphodiesterase 9
MPTHLTRFIDKHLLAKAVLFELLKRRECNILANLDDKTFREVRKGIIRGILSTDMAKHGEILGEFKRIADVFDYKDLEHRAQVRCCILLYYCLDYEFYDASCCV